MNSVFRLTNVLDKEILQELINDFQENCTNTYPGRRFNVDINYAVKILNPILKYSLPKNWIVDGGNYFETVVPYRLHCDTGKDRTKKLYYNIVIPLKLWYEDYNPNLNKLIITDQIWNGDAAFFVKGDNALPEYNICITDYEQVENKIEGIDNTLLELCTHLNPRNLEGFSIKKVIDWVPGDIIFFRRHYIHTTSNWRSAGVSQKLGLSLFTSLQ